MPGALNGVVSSNGNGDTLKTKQEVLHVIDSRTGQYQAIPITKNAISASEFKGFKAPKDLHHPEYQNEQGLRIFDPGYSNTTVSESKVTYM